jgi:uncharacterized protein (TIGR02391 family)
MTKKKTSFPVMPPNVLEAISKIAGDTETGLKGREIAKLLADAGIPDVSPDFTKWQRLYNAFVEVQNRRHESNLILKFIQSAYHPTRFLNNEGQFEYVRAELNAIFSFIGLELHDDGIYRPVQTSATISDAKRRESILLTKLNDRNVHEDVLKFCREELLVDNYFHAVFETTKSVADKIRNCSGLLADGSQLVDEAFGLKTPYLLINSLSTETEESEHRGFMNLLKGFFGMFRNTTAHAPKIKWVIEESDALDIMSMASLLHRRIDKATRIRL